MLHRPSYYLAKARFYKSDIQIVSIETADGITEYDIVKNKQSVVFRGGSILRSNKYSGEIEVLVKLDDLINYNIQEYRLPVGATN